MPPDQIAQSRLFRFSVTMLIPTKTGLVWWGAEKLVPANMTDEQALEWLGQILIEDGQLLCHKFTLGNGSGPREIQNRTPVLISQQGYASITPLHVDVYDPADGGQP